MTAPSAFRQQPEVRKSKSGTFLPGKPAFVAGEPGSDPKVTGFQQKEVSIRPERRKHLQNMLTSFQIISICFPTLHLLLGFRRLKEKDYSLVVLPKQTSPN